MTTISIEQIDPNIHKYEELSTVFVNVMFNKSVILSDLLKKFDKKNVYVVIHDSIYVPIKIDNAHNYKLTVYFDKQFSDDVIRYYTSDYKHYTKNEMKYYMYMLISHISKYKYEDMYNNLLNRYFSIECISVIDTKAIEYILEDDIREKIYNNIYECIMRWLIYGNPINNAIIIISKMCDIANKDIKSCYDSIIEKSHNAILENIKRYGFNNNKINIQRSYYNINSLYELSTIKVDKKREDICDELYGELLDNLKEKEIDKYKREEMKRLFMQICQSLKIDKKYNV